MPEAPRTSAKWLLLVHQLPARPSNLRVHVWRRLQQIGAVALRNSIYVLPHTPEAREDFDWIRTDITSRGGQVSILSADAIDGYTDDELQASFRAARTAEYEVLIRHAEALTARVTNTQKRLPRAAIQRDVAKVRERYRALKAVDVFGSSRATDALAAIGRLESVLVRESKPSGSPAALDARLFRRRSWLTRPRPGIDRMASAWLIRRFIASDARFVFGALPARPGHIPFDMPDVEFGHHGDQCTYETLMKRFGVTDAAAVRIGHIVHDLDLKESRFGLPDTATIGRLVEGLRDAGSSDHNILESGILMLEALYRSFLQDSGEPTVGRRKNPMSSRSVRPATARRAR